MKDPRASAQFCACYDAVSALLRAESLVRLELGPIDGMGSVTVGLHAGYDDGAFVIIWDDAVMTTKTQIGPEFEMMFEEPDATCARELAASLLAFADWADEAMAAREAERLGHQSGSTPENAPKP